VDSFKLYNYFFKESTNVKNSEQNLYDTGGRTEINQAKERVNKIWSSCLLVLAPYLGKQPTRIKYALIYRGFEVIKLMEAGKFMVCRESATRFNLTNRAWRVAMRA
jgi:hypothetical protein